MAMAMAMAMATAAVYARSILTRVPPPKRSMRDCTSFIFTHNALRPGATALTDILRTTSTGCPTAEMSSTSPQQLRQVFRSQVSISFQHLQGLVAGDSRHLHGVKTLLEETTGGFVAEVVKA